MRQLLLATALLIGLWPEAARAQCPAVIPVPATQPDVACYTNKPVNQRCATAIEPTVCAFLNNTALSQGLVTQGAFDYLGSVHFCAVVNNLGAGFRIFDFCPEGCFAADTQILSSFRSDGRANYLRAAMLSPSDQLVSLADDASFSDVVLTEQAIKRIVSGPEDGELFVFTLANGRTLKVTTHHPMVLDSGKLVEASKVEPGASFVGVDGRSVAIVQISRAKPEADVFNFETGGDTQLNHILVAEGVLTGDLKIQNELSDEDGAIAARR
jgi:hypothetical protein